MSFAVKAYWRHSLADKHVEFLLPLIQKLDGTGSTIRVFSFYLHQADGLNVNTDGYTWISSFHKEWKTADFEQAKKLAISHEYIRQSTMGKNARAC